MVERLGSGTVHLRRSPMQRGYGWFMAFINALLAPGIPVLAAGPWTYFRSDPGAVKWLLLIVAPFVAVAASGTAAAGFRLATSPRGVVRLEVDGITVNDPSVFREPLRLTRSEVATISAAPTGAFAFSVSGAAAKEHAALVSLYAERPNVLVKFTQPRLMTMARRNYGLTAHYALRAPSPKKEVWGLWLRTEDLAGRDRLVAWAS